MDSIVWYIQENFWAIIWKGGMHFISSGFVGLLVYWLTSTTLSRYLSGGSSIQVSPKVAFGIHRFSLFLALVFAIWFHILIDYTVNWF